MGKTDTRWDHQPKDKLGAFNPPKLQQKELELFEVLKHHKPSMPYTELKRTVERYCDIPGAGTTSKSALSRCLQSRMLDGKSWSWRRMSYKPTNKFHPENVNYCQDFLNYMSTIDPYCIKSFDEAGFKLPDVSKPNCRHAPKG